MSDLDDIDEGEISDLSDGELNAVVAEWLVDEPGPMTYDPPDYCNDDAAAMRLLRRLPGQMEAEEWCYQRGRDSVLYDLRVTRENGKLHVAYVEYQSPTDDRPADRLFVQYDDRDGRALAEAAATLRVRGVEPREVPNA